MLESEQVRQNARRGKLNCHTMALAYGHVQANLAIRFRPRMMKRQCFGRAVL